MVKIMEILLRVIYFCGDSIVYFSCWGDPRNLC